MTSNQLIKTAAWAGLLLCLALGGVYADVYIESEQVSQGVPGKQQTDTSIMKQYLTMDAVRTDMDDRITIINFKEKMMYVLDPAAKTYTKGSVEQMGVPTGPDADEMANNPMFQAMMKSMAESIKVTPTGETKTVAGYKCKKYLVNIMMTQSDFWVTQQIAGLDELKAIGERTAALFKGNPMMQQADIIGMMKELDGYPVQTETKMMGMNITSTLKKIETKKLDKDLFKIPGGYKLVQE